MQYLIFAIVLMSCVIASFLEGVQQGENRQIAKQAKIETLLTTEFTRQQNEITKSIQAIQVTQTTIVKRAEKTIIETPVYRDCKHDPSVLRDINTAIANPKQSGSSGKPEDNSMPRPNPTSK